MIRAIAAITIAVFVFVGLPYAAFASSGCSEKHENVSRFNPTELSEYQKCVFEWTGQEIGTIGHYIWMQHNGDYIYVPIADLQGKSRAKQERVIVKTIVEIQLETEIREIRTQIEVLKVLDISDELQTQLNKRLTALETATANINAITTTAISETHTLEELLDADYNHTHITVTVGDRTYSIGETATRFVSNKNGNNATVTIGGLTLTQLINEVRSEIQNAYNDGYSDGYKQGYQDGWNDAVDAMNNG